MLTNDNHELFAVVPNVRPVRPAIQTAPFTTELVLDRLDDAGLAWTKKTKVGAVYEKILLSLLCSMHLTRVSLFISCLAQLRFFLLTTTHP